MEDLNRTGWGVEGHGQPRAFLPRLVGLVVAAGDNSGHTRVQVPPPFFHVVLPQLVKRSAMSDVKVCATPIGMYLDRRRGRVAWYQAVGRHAVEVVGPVVDQQLGRSALDGPCGGVAKDLQGDTLVSHGDGCASGFSLVAALGQPAASVAKRVADAAYRRERRAQRGTYATRFQEGSGDSSIASPARSGWM